PFDGDVPPTIGRHNGCNHGISPARLGGKRAARCGYRRRRLPAGTIFRPSSERRLPPPGSRIIGTLLASAAPARPARDRAGKCRSMGIARDPVNSRLPGASLKDYPRSAAMRESMNRYVYDDSYFQVVSSKLPLNCREDGGHLILVEKNKVRDRLDLSYQ